MLSAERETPTMKAIKLRLDSSDTANASIRGTSMQTICQNFGCFTSKKEPLAVCELPFFF